MKMSQLTLTLKEARHLTWILMNLKVTAMSHIHMRIRGVRRLGATAVDMHHDALGIVEAHWE